MHTVYKLNILFISKALRVQSCIQQLHWAWFHTGWINSHTPGAGPRCCICAGKSSFQFPLTSCLSHMSVWEATALGKATRTFSLRALRFVFHFCPPVTTHISLLPLLSISQGWCSRGWWQGRLYLWHCTNSYSLKMRLPSTSHSFVCWPPFLNQRNQITFHTKLQIIADIPVKGSTEAYLHPQPALLTSVLLYRKFFIFSPSLPLSYILPFSCFIQCIESPVTFGHTQCLNHKLASFDCILLILVSSFLNQTAKRVSSSLRLYTSLLLLTNFDDHRHHIAVCLLFPYLPSQHHALPLALPLFAPFHLSSDPQNLSSISCSTRSIYFPPPEHHAPLPHHIYLTWKAKGSGEPSSAISFHIWRWNKVCKQASGKFIISSKLRFCSQLKGESTSADSR